MLQFDGKFIAGFFLKAGLGAVFIYPCMVLLFNTTPMAVRFDQWPTRALLLFAIAIFAAILALPRRFGPWAPARTIVSAWVLVFAVSLPFALLKLIMGDNQVEPILIFLAGDNLGEVLAVGRDSYAGLLLKATGFFTAFILSLIFLVRRYERMDGIVSVLCVVLLLLHPVTAHVFALLVPNKSHAEFDIGKHFAALTASNESGRPKNLVLVYLESLEATFAVLPQTAEGFAPLKALAAGAFSASDIHQVEGTRYTIAGIVATQCGVPLIPYGLNNIGFDHHTEHSLNSIMPGITCLGDILARDGYTVSYMNGASLERYSKRGFLTSHGYDRLFGLESVDATTIAGRDNVFGMNDGVLFEHVFDELDTLKRLDKPFLLSVLTVGTHGPHGFHDRDCSRERKDIGGLAAAIRCAGESVERLLEALRRKGLAENTLVAVMSDHLVINRHLIYAPAMSRAMAGVRDDRRNLFFLRGYGIAAQKTPKPAAMIDVYPTLLEALGYDLPDGRANLGVSLFNDKPTLVGTFGAHGVDDLFLQNTRLAEFLWTQNSSPPDTERPANSEP